MKKKQNPVVYYLCVFAYCMLMLLLRLVMLAPLSSLFLFPESSPLRFLALLTPAILLFVVLPLRFSFADAIVRDDPHERFFSIGKALSFSRYGSKLCQSLIHASLILLWGIPAYIVVGYSYYMYSVGANLSFLSSYLPKIGEIGVGITYPIANFFLKLAGKELLVIPKQTLAEGIVYLLVLIGITLAIWLIGAVLCSGRRYLWALSEHHNTTINTEYRRHLMGRRWAQLGNGLVNFLLVVPILAVTGFLLRDLITEVYDNILLLLTGVMPSLDGLKQNALYLVLAFFGLYMTVLPIRRYRTATFISLRSRQPRNPNGKKQSEN